MLVKALFSVEWLKMDHSTVFSGNVIVVILERIRYVRFSSKRWTWKSLCNISIKRHFITKPSKLDIRRRYQRFMHDANNIKNGQFGLMYTELKHTEIQSVFSTFNPITDSTKSPEWFERNLFCTNMKIAGYHHRMQRKEYNWSYLKVFHTASAKNSLISLSSYSAKHLIVCPQTLMNLCCLLYQLDEKLQAH